MKVGDLVAHRDPHIYMDEPKGERSLGIVVEVSRRTQSVKVYWPNMGRCFQSEHRLEVINENR